MGSLKNIAREAFQLITHQPRDRDRALFIAAIEEGNVETIDKMVKRFGAALINAPRYNPESWDPQFCKQGSGLTRAAECKRGDLVIKFLKHGADVHIRNEKGQTALHICAQNHMDIPCIELMGRGAEVNVSDHEGRTPLMHALGNKMLGTCLVLLERNAEVNVANKQGQTPLMLARDSTAVLLLLKRGARVEDADNEGLTVLAYFARQGLSAEIFAVLENAHVTPQHLALALIEAASHGQQTCVTSLLNSGADINGTDAKGQTALMACALTEQVAMADYLLSQGADPTLRDHQGRTAIDYFRQTIVAQMSSPATGRLASMMHQIAAHESALEIHTGLAEGVELSNKPLQLRPRSRPAQGDKPKGGGA